MFVSDNTRAVVLRTIWYTSLEHFTKTNGNLPYQSFLYAASLQLSRYYGENKFLYQRKKSSDLDLG